MLFKKKIDFSDLQPLNIPTLKECIENAKRIRLKHENETLQAVNKTLRRAFPYKCGQKVYTVIDGRIFRHIIREIRFTAEDVYIDGVTYKNVYPCLKKAQAAQRKGAAE